MPVYCKYCGDEITMHPERKLWYHVESQLLACPPVTIATPRGYYD